MITGITISYKKSEKYFYLDVCKYLAAGTSLEKFYAAYNVKFPKGHFPYQWFDLLENLEYTELPPSNEFYSHLIKESISQSKYEICIKEWQEQNMKTFGYYITTMMSLD